MTGDNSFGVGVSYIEFIYKFGTPVILTPKNYLDLPEVDLIIAPGGADILPTSYGEMPGFKTQKSNTVLEHFDAKILPQYIGRKTPVFAICRGMQRIWAMYGGKIDQHNSWHEQSKHPHDQCHELSFTKDYQHLNKDVSKVTSRHHQCVDASEFVPDELEVIAYAGAHNKYYPNIVEIFKHKTLPIIGVQFHPEDHDSSDVLSIKLIEELLNT